MSPCDRSRSSRASDCRPPPDPRLLELEAALKAVSVDDLTPRAALDLIYKLRALLG